MIEYYKFQNFCENVSMRFCIENPYLCLPSARVGQHFVFPLHLSVCLSVDLSVRHKIMSTL